MKKILAPNANNMTLKAAKKQSITMPRYGGCGEGWTCDRCPNIGCPANERN